MLMAGSFTVNADKTTSNKSKAQAIDLTLENTIVLYDTVDESTVQPIINFLVAKDKAGAELGVYSPVYIVLNTPGGSVSQGLRLIAAIGATTSPVVCIVDEMAYSMGAAIISFCPTVYVQEDSDIMYHPASFSISGDEFIVATRLEHTQKMLKQFHTKLANRFNMSYDEWVSKIRNEWWLNADDALKLGISKKTITKLSYHFEKKQSFFSLFGKKRSNDVYWIFE
jgi:ATP-dependent protease ClpP protease subunit